MTLWAGALNKSHYHAKYSHQKHCGRYMVLVGHVILQDYLIRESSNFLANGVVQVVISFT